MMEVHNSPPTPPRTSHSSQKTFDSSPMSSYRYPPANPEIQGAWSQAQYPQQQYTIPNEHYRAQPTIPPTSGAPLNLPPLRSIDPRQQQAYTPPASAGPSYGGAQMVAGYPPMPGHMPAMPPQPQYYAGPMQHPAGHYDPAAYGQPMMRYPLPMGDPGRALQGGRHKKDVKRRTKTGCLTCRRRRIKVSPYSTSSDVFRNHIVSLAFRF